MNKTDRILGMLMTASELQNTTSEMIKEARNDIKEADDIMKQVILKIIPESLLNDPVYLL